jgi:hypothetical protein
VKKDSFGLLELEMADLERFWRKTPLGPLGVNSMSELLFTIQRCFDVVCFTNWNKRHLFQKKKKKMF